MSASEYDSNTVGLTASWSDKVAAAASEKRAACRIPFRQENRVINQREA